MAVSIVGYSSPRSFGVVDWLFASNSLVIVFIRNILLEFTVMLTFIINVNHISHCFGKEIEVHVVQSPHNLGKERIKLFSINIEASFRNEA